MPEAVNPGPVSETGLPKVQVSGLPLASVVHSAVSFTPCPADLKLAGWQPTTTLPASSQPKSSWGCRLERDSHRPQTPGSQGRDLTREERSETGRGLRDEKGGAGPEEAEHVPIKARLAKDEVHSGLDSWPVQKLACL